MDLQEVVYEDFTRFFYVNMKVDWKDEEINIFIKGKEHTLNVALLNKILEVLNEQDYLTPTHGTLSIPGYKLKKIGEKVN